MNNTAGMNFTELENASSQSSDFSFPVGITYLTTASIFIPLQLICAYLIRTDKEMRNPTYQFMITLSVMDTVELGGIGLYAGSVLITKVQYDAVDRCIDYVMTINWYVHCLLLVFVAFSRWIAITRPEKTDFIFTKKTMRYLQIGPWIIFGVVYFYPLAIRKLFHFVADFYTWGFDLQTTIGETLHWVNFVFNTLCAIIETTFNVLSLKWVHELRKSISTALTTDKNYRREIKLLIQCAIIGFLFTIGEILFTIAIFGGTVPIFFLTQALWTANHCINPIVYLAINTRLRKRFLSFISCGNYAKNAVTSINVTANNAGSRM